MLRSFKRTLLLWLVVMAVTITACETICAQVKRRGPARGKRPTGEWFTIKTKHFYVHFPKGSRELAKRAARVAEDVHKRLTVDVKWRLKSRTHIILLDWADSTNGWAVPIPRNTIAVRPVAPGVPELELAYTDDWLRLVITHEYAHILTLDMVSGLPAIIRKVFGRSVSSVPNAFLPQWILEGYAVYMESKHTAGGRLNGPYFDMVLRTAVLEGKFNSIAQAQSGVDSWPRATQYIYGAMFCKFREICRTWPVSYTHLTLPTN